MQYVVVVLDESFPIKQVIGVQRWLKHRGAAEGQKEAEKIEICHNPFLTSMAMLIKSRVRGKALKTFAASALQQINDKQVISFQTELGNTYAPILWFLPHTS